MKLDPGYTSIWMTLAKCSLGLLYLRNNGSGYIWDVRSGWGWRRSWQFGLGIFRDHGSVCEGQHIHIIAKRSCMSVESLDVLLVSGLGV